MDIQQLTPHTAQFGAIEIPRAEYLRRLAEALTSDVTFGDPRRKRPCNPRRIELSTMGKRTDSVYQSDQLGKRPCNPQRHELPLRVYGR